MEKRRETFARLSGALCNELKECSVDADAASAHLPTFRFSRQNPFKR
ncbi:MAG: hypothetical protein ACOH2K_14365 [Burkholderiaceae bacterium]